jgi:uncharacterized protein YbjT (DUF2867 family)
MDNQPILVLGATGTTGRRVVRQLRAAACEVRAASRKGEVRFDWSDPDTWEPALSGVRRMYLMAPDEVAVDATFVRCAVDQGVRHIVLLSSRAIEVMGDERLMAAERVVRESGTVWTILRSDWFNQNFDEGFFRPAVVAGELALPVGSTRQVFVDADDLAAVAASVLTEDGHDGKSYEVTGPQALSFGEALEIIGRESGRRVRFGGADEDYVAQQQALGVPDEQTQLALASFAALRDLGDQHPTDTVRRVAGREPKTFTAFAEEAARRGAWRE